MSWVVGFGRFWYRFIIGDDWTLAAAVAAALILTRVLSARGAAWWLVPLTVVIMVRVGVQRARRPYAAGAGSASNTASG
ncbi:MAG: hypothetical protein E6J14_07280 [Chloroflexi bacterium]|nr:MAG: hypothetical protein E6J14_07280 [Chloroflexota bacterium]